MNIKKIMSHLSLFAFSLAFVVVILGVYTRISNAGLSCPDWPGCYNQLIVPESQLAIQKAEQLYPHNPIEPIKAWSEMIHRYVAATLGFTILILATLSLFRIREKKQAKIVPFLLLILALFQITLGKWTVTLKLAPLVVMGHLLGGFAILALLWWFYLRNRSQQMQVQYYLQQGFNATFWISLGIVMLICQIILGGWTSANYASLVCPDFPSCTMDAFFPVKDFHLAFMSFSTYLTLGRLSHAALVTIQMSHRFGAILLGTYFTWFGLTLLFKGNSFQRGMGIFILILLAIQISLGILNVKMLLPLTIVVAHNGVAALLLLSMVTLFYHAFYQMESKRS